MPSALFGTLFLNAAQASLPRTRIPAFIYGCAWKKEQTADLVHKALLAGFTGIDVAAQPKHYRPEDLAGEGMRRALAEGKVKREDIFLQTKYTSVNGQDPGNMPYDPKASVTDQVHSSIASSLKNLRPAEKASDGEDVYIDSLVLHSPLPTMKETMEAWQACEQYVPKNIRNLGISNTSLPILEALHKSARVKPVVVQNRFYPQTHWDIPLRKFCSEHGIVYQSFWTLTGNPQLLRSAPVRTLQNDAVVDREVALYALVLGLEDTVILNGTSSHMSSDLEQLERVKRWARENPYDWENAMKQFRGLINDYEEGELVARFRGKPAGRGYERPLD